MIAIDSSALLAMVLGEPEGQVCSSAIQNADRVLISVATLTETFIVALGRQVSAEAHRLVGRINPRIIPVDGATALRIERIYRSDVCSALNFGVDFARDVDQFSLCGTGPARKAIDNLIYAAHDNSLTEMR